MICEICKKNQATIHFVMNVNGKVTKINICESCAAGGGMEILASPEKSFNLLNKFLSSLAMAETAEDKECPTCGKKLSEFKDDGKLGCPRCWDVFREDIVPLLKKLHGVSFHNRKKSPLRKENKISEAEKIQDELRRAVDEENYEKAAELRDRLRDLKSSDVKK